MGLRPGKYDPDFFALVTGSFERLVGRRLCPDGGDAAWLYDRAPFPVLAHDGGSDPLFVYANRAAQDCFDYSWDELIGLPSRLSAEAPERAARLALLERVRRDGYAEGYEGVRVAKSGRRFVIEAGVVWNLVDEAGGIWGQAATFPSWRPAGEP